MESNVGAWVKKPQKTTAGTRSTSRFTRTCCFTSRTSRAPDHQGFICWRDAPARGLRLPKRPPLGKRVQINSRYDLTSNPLHISSVIYQLLTYDQSHVSGASVSVSRTLVSTQTTCVCVCVCLCLFMSVYVCVCVCQIEHSTLGLVVTVFTLLTVPHSRFVFNKWASV